MYKITIGGDLYLKHSYLIKDNINLFNNSDFSILNLEAPVLDGRKKAYSHKKSGPNLAQKTDSLNALLANLGVNYLVGANNHIFDYGQDGLDYTIDYLMNKGIGHTGFGKNIQNATRPMTLGKTNIVVLSTAEEEFGVASSNTSGYLSIYGSEIIKSIQVLKKKRKVVIVCPHGGGEEVPLPSKYIYSRYREIIDAGADIIIGHHPHVPQGYEIYKSKYIFYSLGNFIHDSYSKSWGMLLKLLVDDSRGQISVKPYAANVSAGKLNIDELTVNQLDYLSRINDILLTQNDYDLMLQVQSVDMYKDYYGRYVQRILDASSRRWYVKQADIEREENRELLFLNLIRNKSHSEFIERALKIKYSEITKKFNDIFVQKYGYLKKYIKNNFK
ncbi:MAG: CapA family protein [bacterium]|nr:MAG: CapA family protein [bacterium]